MTTYVRWAWWVNKDSMFPSQFIKGELSEEIIEAKIIQKQTLNIWSKFSCLKTYVLYSLRYLLVVKPNSPLTSF